MLSSAARDANLMTVESSVTQSVVSTRECARKLCRHSALDDSDFCDEHARQKRQYDAARMARRRQGWAKAKRCTNCGAEKRKPGSRWCLACVIKDGRIKGASVTPPVVTTKADRVAARLIPWENSPTNEGRKGRIRSGDRGRPSVQVENRTDFDLTETELAAFVVKVCGSIDAARRGEAHVWSDEAKGLPPIQRRAAVTAVLDHVHVAYRLLGEILRRGRHPGAPGKMRDPLDDEET